MHRVFATMSRREAERLSDHLSGLDPSPSAAVAIEEISRTLWRLEAFCHDETSAREAAAFLEHELGAAPVKIEALEDRDWVARSLEGLPAVHAGPFTVAGAHELSRVAGGRIPIWIEAGPAFGTGHHGTTKGCLEAIASIARRHKLGRVLDVGTGSGVLAIAAVKAGAAAVVASDIDAEAVRISRENAVNNQTGPALRFVHAVGANSPAIRARAPYDLVLANILAKPLVRLAADLVKLAKPGGLIVVSGLLSHQEPEVRAAYAGRGLTLQSRLRIAGWSTLTWRRPRHRRYPTPMIGD